MNFGPGRYRTNMPMFHIVSAIQALVKSITIINENTSVIRVLVNSILKRGKVHIQDNRHIDLWVNTDCVCPSLRPHKEYLIVGHENVMYNKLNYGQDSLVTRWGQKWVKKFKVSSFLEDLKTNWLYLIKESEQCILLDFHCLKI